MFNKKKRLIEVLKKLKMKLELRKKRFELWGKELDETENYTREVMNKSIMCFSKSRRLGERISYIEDSIRSLR